VNRDGEHIEADQALPHHCRMQLRGIAAIDLVQKPDPLVGRGQQRSRAAGEIANSQPRDWSAIAPVYVQDGIVDR
jgi:hypothetical protein